MVELFEVMAAQHGVASSAQARAAGISWHVENVLVRRGVVGRPAAGVLVSRAAPRTWHQRAIEAVFAPGDAVLSHAAAARLHGLDGFDRYDFVDVLCRKGWWPHPPAGTITHFTRGLTDAADVTEVDSIRVLTVPATLTLLAPTAGLGPTARAVDSALRLGHHLDELREVAIRWKKRGRAGPPTLLTLLDERDGRCLPRSWFQRLAKNGLERSGIRLVDEYPVRDERGVLIAELDLAEPRRKIGDRVSIVAMARHARCPTSRRPPTRRAAISRLGGDRRLVA